MPGVLATLYAASAQSSNFYCTLCNGGYLAPSAADLKDASDATYAKGDWYGDGFSVDDGYFREDWTIDAASGPTWVITSVKVRIRATYIDYYAFMAKVQPRIGETNRGTPLTVTPPYNWYEFEFATDPADSQPWTVAKINGYKWGFEANCEDVSDTSAAGELYVAEFQVQVLGNQQTQGEVAEVNGQGLAGVAGLVTAGAIAGCIGQGTVGHSSHGTTHGQPAVAIGYVIPKDSSIPSGPAPLIRPLLGTTLRPTSPSELGDQDLSTLVQDQILIPPGSTTGTNQVVASTISDVVGDPGSIASITFTIRAMFDYPGPAFVTIDEMRLKWTVDGDTQTYVFDESEHIGSFGLPGVDREENTISQRILGPFGLQPNGSPWTIAALNAIEDVTLEADYDFSGSGAQTLQVFEIAIEVTGAPPADVQARRIFTLETRRVTGIPFTVSEFPVGAKSTTKIGGTKVRKVVIAQ